jgi:putative transposase
VDFIDKWSEKTGLGTLKLVEWSGLSRSKFYDWRERYGKANEHNAKVPRDTWIETWEQAAIVDFHGRYPLEGYRRLTFMMLDQDVVAVSPSTTYRVLKRAGLLDRKSNKKSLKGTGYVQPLKAHQEWHIDISYLNIAGTFYYMCTVLDGYSRYIVHWEIRESMQEWEVELVIQKALEKFPGAKPRIISDNGPQFIAKDFKEFIRLGGMTHVRTAPFYPQSNGKIERYHKTVKRDCIRVAQPQTREEAESKVAAFVAHYNQVRLHSAIGYVTPHDKLNGRETAIFDERDRKLATAREKRRENRIRLRSEQYAHLAS